IAAVWGVSEASLPGPGLSAYELLDALGTAGGVPALFIMGSNVAVSAPHTTRIERPLRALDLLVVSDFFLSETAAPAQVVLPSAEWPEEDGTMTNLEGGVIRRRRAYAPPTGVWTDLEILTALADRLGFGSHFATTDSREVFDELRRATRGSPADYSGITYERI